MPLEFKEFSIADRDNIQSKFEACYEILFGRTIEGLAIEITNWSVVVATVLPQVDQVDMHKSGSDATPKRSRSFYDAALRQMVDAQEVERSEMRPGMVVDGPAVIIETETSTIVTSAYSAIGQADGSLLLLRKGEAK